MEYTNGGATREQAFAPTPGLGKYVNSICPCAIHGNINTYLLLVSSTLLPPVVVHRDSFSLAQKEQGKAHKALPDVQAKLTSFPCAFARTLPSSSVSHRATEGTQQRNQREQYITFGKMVQNISVALPYAYAPPLGPSPREWEAAGLKPPFPDQVELRERMTH